VPCSVGAWSHLLWLQIREWEPKEVWISEERLGVQLVNMADNKTLVRPRRIEAHV
jgi:hypothetical protein